MTRKIRVVDYIHGKRDSDLVDTNLPFTDNYKETKSVQSANVVIGAYVNKNFKDNELNKIRLDGVESGISIINNNINDINGEINNINGELLNKQNTLISGTNIKTINNKSIVGEGNIDIESDSVWGQITGTLSQQKDLQSALNDKANMSEIPTNISELTNDSGYLISSDFKTVNNVSVVGSGNIDIPKTVVNNVLTESNSEAYSCNYINNLGVGGEPIGIIFPFAGNSIPDGFLLCDGSEVSRTTYSKLFEVIGTTFGSGNGTTTFNIPNLKGKTLVGINPNDTDLDEIGKSYGEKSHQLTINEMPKHSHRNAHYVVGTNAPGYSNWEETVASGDNGSNYRASADSNETGGGNAHNNMQPSLVINYIIKYDKK